MRSLLEETLKTKITDKMMDSYVNLQFSAEDKNFNGLIEMDEFISLYSKIYIDPEVQLPSNFVNLPILVTNSHASKSWF